MVGETPIRPTDKFTPRVISRRADPRLISAYKKPVLYDRDVQSNSELVLEGPNRTSSK